MMNATRTFTCAVCDETFESDTSEEEILAEYLRRNPDSKATSLAEILADGDSVCETCAREYEAWRKKQKH